jgi:hypothetical protein
MISVRDSIFGPDQYFSLLEGLTGDREDRRTVEVRDNDGEITELPAYIAIVAVVVGAGEIIDDAFCFEERGWTTARSTVLVTATASGTVLHKADYLEPGYIDQMAWLTGDTPEFIVDFERDTEIIGEDLYSGSRF